MLAVSLLLFSPTLCWNIFFPFLLCFIKVAVHRKGLESSKVKVYVNRRSSLQQKTLQPSASPVVPPLILWLCDITLGRQIAHLHNLCILICKNWFFDKLLCCCLQCWVRCAWTDQSEGGLGSWEGRPLHLQIASFFESPVQNPKTQKNVLL